MPLTVEEKAEIVNLARTRSYRKTAEAFNQLHPNRQRPLNFRTVYTIFKQLQTRGTLQRKKRTSPPRTIAIKQEFKRAVWQCFTDNQHMTTRRAAAIFGTSQWTIWSALKEMNFRPYKMAKHQKLHPDDPPKRKEFCERLLEIFNEDPEYQRCILWTDEKPFPVNGCFNRQNFRYDIHF